MVQFNAVSFPTEAKLLQRAREHLVQLAQTRGVKLHQSYRRLAHTDDRRRQLPDRNVPQGHRVARRYLRAEVAARPDATIAELRTWLGPEHEVTVSNGLMGATLKRTRWRRWHRPTI
jgi:RNase P/RNase MRP subunit p30